MGRHFQRTARQRPDGGWETLTTANSGLPGNGVSALAGDGVGGLWIATGYGLVHKRTDGVWERIDSSASGLRDRGGSSDTQMQVLAGDGRGGVWVGAVARYCTSAMRGCYQPDWESGGGLAHYDAQGNWRQFTAQETGLPHTSVTALAEDGHGGIWISLGDRLWEYQDLLVHYDGNIRQVVSMPFAPEGYISSLTSDGKKGVWVINNGELYHYDGNGWRQFPRDATADMAFLLERVPHLYPQYPASLKLLSALSENFYARDAIPDGRGGFWAISEANGGNVIGYAQQSAFQLSHIGPQGLWQASGDKFSYRDGWFKPVEDHAGGVWVAGERSLLHYNALGQRIEERVPPYPLDAAYSVSALAIDAQGGIWLGNGKGELLHYDGHAWQTTALVPPQPPGFGTPPGSALFSIAPDAGGVWVGLAGKLAWYDGTQARLFDLQELLGLEAPEQTYVNSLLPDGQGGVWLGAPDRLGLAHFDGQSTWRRWVQGGFPIQPDPDGSLWIGGNGGMGAHLRFH